MAYQVDSVGFKERDPITPNELSGGCHRHEDPQLVAGRSFDVCLLLSHRPVVTHQFMSAHSQGTIPGGSVSVTELVNVINMAL